MDDNLRLEELSPRQKMICLLCSVGQLNKQIAAQLFVSVRVVELERQRIAKTIGIPTSELIIWAVENRKSLWTSVETSSDFSDAVRLKIAARCGCAD